ncbi:hypothetical protein D3C84_660390 [compost metagenome]
MAAEHLPRLRHWTRLINLQTKFDYGWLSVCQYVARLDRARAPTGSCLAERARFGKLGEGTAGVVKRRGVTAVEDFQLGGCGGLLRQDRLPVVDVDGLALGQKIGQYVTLHQKLIANARLAGQLLKTASVGRQVEAGENFTALAAMLFEQDDQCLFLRQNVLEQWHVAAVQGKGFGLQQLQQLLRGSKVVGDQLQ